MKPFFRTPYNTTHNEPGQKFLKPSLTVPDQNMSIDEMLRRHAVGLPVDGARIPMYDESEDGTINDPLQGVDPRTLDLSELQELRDQVIEKVKEIKRQERKRQDEEIAAAKQKQIDELVAKRMSEMSVGRPSGDLHQSNGQKTNDELVNIS